MAVVFHINFSELSKAQCLDFIRNRIEHRQPCYIVTPNLHFARLAARNENFLSALNEAELRLCDSAILTRMLAIKGTPLPARLTGSDLTPELLDIAEKEGLRVFLFGSDRETLEKVRARYPRSICGIESPPVCDCPWDLEDLNEQYLWQIKKARPDLLFVALGVRKQEYWARKYFLRAEVPVTLCIGASLDFIGERIRRAPRFVSRIGMEWLWRLCLEPGRLWKRYSGDAGFILKFGIREILVREGWPFSWMPQKGSKNLPTVPVEEDGCKISE